MSVHDRGQPAARPVGLAILTISDSRTPQTDSSGRAVRDLSLDAGHSVLEQAIVRDEPEAITSIVRAWARRTDIHLIVTTGGTGISRRDSTYDAVGRLFDQTLPGFGELFRLLSFQEIGSAAMLSRATAGIIDATAVFVLPGSEAAVRLAMTRLILPEVGHITRELTR